MSVRLFRVRLLAATVAALLIAAGAPGQTAPSSIAGVVRDATGLALPGVSVRIANEANVSVETVTDASGAYRTADLAAGTYRVEAVLDGFEAALQRVIVPAGQATSLDLTLNPARFTEGVIVTARPVAFSTKRCTGTP